MHKSRLKQLIYGSELRTTAIIANGLVHKVPKAIILREIRNDLVKLTNSVKSIVPNFADFNNLYNKAYSDYVKTSKKVFAELRKTDKVLKESGKKTPDYQEALISRQNIVYKQLRNTVLPNLVKERNELCDRLDREGKRQNLMETLEEGVFYLCSSHEKPAKDHADWEGKIYITEYWEARVSDPVIQKKIKAYIRNHKTKTVEWVVGEPVYLVFRPNCKHYFIRVSVEEVLGNSAKTLLKRHKAYIPYEEPMSESYRAYKGYYEKLKALQYLKTMCPSQELEADIKRTTKLVRKWYALSKKKN